MCLVGGCFSQAVTQNLERNMVASMFPSGETVGNAVLIQTPSAREMKQGFKNNLPCSESKAVYPATGQGTTALMQDAFN